MSSKGVSEAVCCGVGMLWGIRAFARFRGLAVLDGVLDMIVLHMTSGCVLGDYFSLCMCAMRGV